MKMEGDNNRASRMKDFYSRAEVANLFDPPVSANCIRRMEIDKRMPASVKRVNKAYYYEKKEIDKFMLNPPALKQCGRKKGGETTLITHQDKDCWNIRKNKKKIAYTGIMVDVIRFLQPALTYRNVGNHL
jgi:hypothetical protein